MDYNEAMVSVHNIGATKIFLIFDTMLNFQLATESIFFLHCTEKTHETI